VRVKDPYVEPVTPPSYIQDAIDKLRPVADGEHCITCGAQLTGRQTTFCSMSCYGKNYRKYNWSEVRKRILKRDNYRCTECGSTRLSDLQVHHIKPVKTHPELVIEPSNLITHCRKCHIRKEGHRRRFNERFPSSKITEFMECTPSE